MYSQQVGQAEQNDLGGDLVRAEAAPGSEHRHLCCHPNWDGTNIEFVVGKSRRHYTGMHLGPVKSSSRSDSPHSRSHRIATQHSSSLPAIAQESRPSNTQDGVDEQTQRVG
jgi:hypothetical protein